MPILLKANGTSIELAQDELTHSLIEDHIGAHPCHHDFDSGLKTGAGEFVSLVFSQLAKEDGEPKNQGISQIISASGLNLAPIHGHALLLSEEDLIGYAKRRLGARVE